MHLQESVAGKPGPYCLVVPVWWWKKSLKSDGLFVYLNFAISLLEKHSICF
jgi:hypothetical protein